MTVRSHFAFTAVCFLVVVVGFFFVFAYAYGHEEEDNTAQFYRLLHTTLVPDLTIRSVAVEPRKILAGEHVSFTIRIHNGGNATAGVSRTRIEIDGVPAAVYTAPAIGIDGDYTVYGTDIRRVEAGTVAYEICADADGTVRERDESNNCTIGMLEIAPKSSFFSLSVSFFDIMRELAANIGNLLFMR